MLFHGSCKKCLNTETEDVYFSSTVGVHCNVSAETAKPSSRVPLGQLAEVRGSGGERRLFANMSLNKHPPSPVAGQTPRPSSSDRHADQIALPA